MILHTSPLLLAKISSTSAMGHALTTLFRDHKPSKLSPIQYWWPDDQWTRFPDNDDPINTSGHHYVYRHVHLGPQIIHLPAIYTHVQTGLQRQETTTVTHQLHQWTKHLPIPTLSATLEYLRSRLPDVLWTLLDEYLAVSMMVYTTNEQRISFTCETMTPTAIHPWLRLSRPQTSPTGEPGRWHASFGFDQFCVETPLYREQQERCVMWFVASSLSNVRHFLTWMINDTYNSKNPDANCWKDTHIQVQKLPGCGSMSKDCKVADDDDMYGYGQIKQPKRPELDLELPILLSLRRNECPKQWSRCLYRIRSMFPSPQTLHLIFRLRDILDFTARVRMFLHIVPPAGPDD